MKAWVKTDETGHIICSVVAEKYAAEDMSPIEVDEDFDFSLQADYVLNEDGTLTYDGAWSAKLEEERKAAQVAQETEEQLKVAAKMFVRSRTDMSDEEAVAVSHLHNEWTVGETYRQGKIIQYQGELYRCGQPEITASDTYRPGDEGTTALYSHIEIGEGGYEVWKEWDGVSGIYALGQKVYDDVDGQLYESLTPNNVWGPPRSTPDHWRLVPSN